MSFPRYPKYKPSGVEWLGEVPEHWEVKPLKVVASFNDEVLSETFGADEEIEYVDIGSVSFAGGIERTETMLFGNAPSRARRKVRDGDVIASTVRTYLKAIAPVIDPPSNMIVSTGFAVIRPGLGMVHHFGKFSLQTNYFVDAVISRSTGVSYPAINASEMAGISITLPPLPEQTRIAAFLDAETAKIDELVAEQRRLMDLLKEKRQAVISHAVTRGLNPNAPMKSSGIEWLGEVPEHWEVMKMKWVAEMESGHTPDKKVTEYWENGDIPWVSLNDTGFLKDNDYISDTAYTVSQIGIENSSARLLPARVVVFSRDATIGRCAITTRPMAVSQHFIAWVCGQSIIPEFLLLRLRSMTRELERLTTGATLKTIGMPDVRTIVTPVPPLEEQRAIIDWVSNETAKIDTLTAEAQRAIDLLQERRTALLSAAVTGQIDVRTLPARPKRPPTI
jgi:type I restriction enzyme S subunit